MTSEPTAMAIMTALDETIVMIEKDNCFRVGVYRHEFKCSVFVVVTVNSFTGWGSSEIFSSLDEAMNRYQDILESFGE